MAVKWLNSTQIWQTMVDTVGSGTSSTFNSSSDNSSTGDDATIGCEAGVTQPIPLLPTGTLLPNFTPTTMLPSTSVSSSSSSTTTALPITIFESSNHESNTIMKATTLPISHLPVPPILLPLLHLVLCCCYQNFYHIFQL